MSEFSSVVSIRLAFSHISAGSAGLSPNGGGGGGGANGPIYDTINDGGSSSNGSSHGGEHREAIQ